MHKYSLRGAGKGQPYNAATYIRFRKAVLMSLLGHLRCRTTVHITVDGEGEGGFARLHYSYMHGLGGSGDGYPCLKRATLVRRRPKIAPRCLESRWE